MLEKLKKLIFNKAFLLGLLFGIGLFSKYIFGYNNLAEEVAEFFIFKATGEEVNFSPEQPEDPNNSLNSVIKNWESRKK